MKEAIYGAGGNGKILLTYLQEKGKDIDFFIDEFSDAQEVMGKPVYRLAECHNRDIQIYVFISQYSNQVKEAISCKFEEVLNYSETVMKFPGLFPLFTKDMIPPEYSAQQEQEIQALRGLLKDCKSKELLDQILKFRAKPSVETFVSPSNDLQYLPSDINVFKKGDLIRAIDVGSFDGCNVVNLLGYAKEKGFHVENISAVEPSPSNMTLLREKLKKLGEDLGKGTTCHIFPNAISSKKEILRLAEGQGQTSYVSQNGSLEVAAISIDECHYFSRPNLIMMDVEGYEKAALLGAKETITDHQPTLMISAYHKPNDLWELALLINEINPNYDMYLRYYGEWLNEIILYCLPKQLAQK